MAQKKGLGKGLGALIPEQTNNGQKSDDVVLMMKIKDIEPNREQPRQTFQEEGLDELSASIKEHGVIQPILVRKNGEYYEIVAGERRWRAARMAGLRELPVIVRDYDELKSLEIALIENLQRENLNAVDEALTYKRLQDEFHLTQDAIAEKVGKNRSTITNALRILNLPESVLKMLSEGKLSAGHAKALLALDGEKRQLEVAEKIIEMDLSVRKAEALVKKICEISAHSEQEEPSISAQNLIYYRSVERELHTLLGTKVRVSNTKNKGKIEIEYFSDGDLNRLLELFKRLEA